MATGPAGATGPTGSTGPTGISIASIKLTTDANGRVTGGTATMSDNTTVPITVG